MIKNYTSTVLPSKSVQRIEALLVEHKARDIIKIYDAGGKLEGVAFTVDIEEKRIAFRLPARIDQVEQLLRGSVKRRGTKKDKTVRDQAERTAWKFMAEWVEIQMGLMDLQQIEFLQAFLPYAYDPVREQTFFDQIKAGGFKMLTDGK